MDEIARTIPPPTTPRSHILSTAPWDDPSAWSDKLLWHHKDLNTGDFLVDDRTHNGADRFRGERVHFGTRGFEDWAAVTAYLLARA